MLLKIPMKTNFGELKGMYQKPNSIPKHGNRNLYCSYYRDFLKQAVRLQWDSFACIECHLELTPGIESERSLESRDTTPYFTLSPDIQLKTETEL
jgi:hypothetical protein